MNLKADEAVNHRKPGRRSWGWFRTDLFRYKDFASQVEIMGYA
jgi:hypothetical protein